MTLCTIPDVSAALGELRRVLKPGASFHFAEHGHSPDDEGRAHPGPVQRLAERGRRRLQPRTATSPRCSPTRASRSTNVRNFYLKGPRAAGYMYVGAARKP